MQMSTREESGAPASKLQCNLNIINERCGVLCNLAPCNDSSYCVKASAVIAIVRSVMDVTVIKWQAYASTYSAYWSRLDDVHNFLDLGFQNSANKLSP